MVSESEAMLRAELAALRTPPTDSSGLLKAIRACTDVADLLKRIGQPQRAMAHADKAVELAETAPPDVKRLDEIKAVVLSNRGAVKRMVGDAAGAAEDQAESRKLGCGEDCAAWNREGLLKMDAKDFAGARRDFRRGIEAHKKSGGEVDATDLVSLLSNLANCEAQTGSLETAVALYDDAVQALKETGSLESPQGASTLQNLGNVQIKRGDFAGADEALSKALEICEKTCTLDGLLGGQLLLNRAIAAWNRMDPAAALPLARKALAILQRLGHEGMAQRAKMLVSMAEQAVSEGSG
mmetsp:Transcript_20869/g.62796  ORF Transcript_20869/g.62796 Transcript_20869/m.62796 type:complete len:296 (+) Transcript_20869:3-890(+)